MQAGGWRRKRGGRTPAAALAVLACAGLSWLGAGCGEPADPRAAASGNDAEGRQAAALWTGDLDEIRTRGRLRILVARGAESGLPRAGSPPHFHEVHAQAFARALDLEPEVIFVENSLHLIPALLRGKGDLIAANLTVTPGRRSRLGFSRPVGRVVEQLVVAASNNGIQSRPARPRNRHPSRRGVPPLGAGPLRSRPGPA